MTKYVVSMKNGCTFIVEIKSYTKFVTAMKEASDKDVKDNFYAQGGVVFNLNEVTAIYPLSSVYAAKQDETEREYDFRSNRFPE